LTTAKSQLQASNEERKYINTEDTNEELNNTTALEARRED
jgi:hypothetical protein